MKEVKTVKEVESLLFSFDDIFIHNHEKVKDYHKWAQKIIDRGFCFSFVIENKEVGIVVFYANDLINKIGFISLIGLKSEWQGQGFARKMLDFSFEKMRDNGMKRVRLEVEKNNIHAIEFYKNNGFTTSSSYEKSFIMEKYLII